MFLSVATVLYDPVSIPRALIIIIVPSILILFGSGGQFKRNHASTMLILLILAYFVSFLLTKQNFAQFLHGSYGRNFGILTLIGLFFIFVISISANTKDFKNFILSLKILSGLSISYAVIQLLKLDPLDWEKHTGFILTLGNPNFSGALLAILSNLFLYQIIALRGKSRIVNVIFYCISIYLCYLNGSLQAWVIVAINLILFFKFFFTMKNVSRTSNFLIKFHNHLNKLLVSIAFLTLTFIVVFPNILDYLNRLGNVESRFRYWSAGFRIFKDNWIFGVGIENVQAYIGQYRKISDVTEEGLFIYSDRLHNVLLDHLVSGGLLAGIIYLIFIFLVFKQIFILRRGQLSSDDKNKYFLVSSIWIGYFFQSLVSPDHIILATLGYISAGLLFTIPINSIKWNNKDNEHKRNINELFSFKSSSFLKITALLCIIVSSITYTRALHLDYTARQYFIGEGQENSNLDMILTSWPNIQILDEVGVNEVKKPDRDCALLNKISARMININFRYSNSWYFKTVCDEKSGNLNGAIESIDNAILYDPLNPVYLVSRGVLEYKTDQLEKLERTITEVKSISPNQFFLNELEDLLLKKIELKKSQSRNIG
jgi:hypothetical protein